MERLGPDRTPERRSAPAGPRVRLREEIHFCSSRGNHTVHVTVGRYGVTERFSTLLVRTTDRAGTQSGRFEGSVCIVSSARGGERRGDGSSSVLSGRSAPRGADL